MIGIYESDEKLLAHWSSDNPVPRVGEHMEFESRPGKTYVVKDVIHMARYAAQRTVVLVALVGSETP